MKRTLLIRANGQPAKLGEQVTDFRGRTVYLRGWSSPDSPHKAGYALVSKGRHDQEWEWERYYVTVFDMKFVAPKGNKS